jgi:hypothetical protein
MKARIRIGAIATAAALLVSIFSGNANAGVSIPSNVPNLGLYFVDNFELGSMPPQIFAVGDWSDATSFLMCSSASDETCTAASHVYAMADLDVCKKGITTSCIAGAWAVDPSGKRIEGKLLKTVQEYPTQSFDAIPEAKFPGSHSLGLIWTFPGVVNSAGSENYLVGVEDHMNGNKRAGALFASAKFDPENFVAGIVPVKEVAGDYGVLKANDIQHGNGAWGSEPVGNIKMPDGTPCVVTDKTYCEVKAQFPENFRFGMTIQLGQAPEGWFSGRLGLPTITTTQNGSAQLLSIEAAPLHVPYLDFVVPNAEIPQAARDLAFNGYQYGRGGTKSWQILGPQSDPRMMQMLMAFVPAFKNTATGTDSIWSFRTMVGGGSRNEVSKCSQGITSLVGLVTSNALTYSDGAPTFDASTGDLTYKVASPHFKEDGKIALGTYDLAIRSDVVRCLYNFTNAPIRATISITSEDGNNQVATTVVNEKDGWLYLSAKGYTFSSPTIAVKMQQDAPAATASPTPVAVKKSTIKCVKGKTSKSVTAVNPKCPAGYKKA